MPVHDSPTLWYNPPDVRGAPGGLLDAPAAICCRYLAYDTFPLFLYTLRIMKECFLNKAPENSAIVKSHLERTCTGFCIVKHTFLMVFYAF